MEHISTVLSRTLPDLDRHARPNVIEDAVTRRPRNLFDLIRTFEAEEALENQDVVAPLSALRMTHTDTLEVPNLGTFAFTDWSRRQCASLLGCRFDRFADPILEAYNGEPRPTAFGLSQAITLASQTMTPEVRFELEQAAGAYLSNLN